LDSRITTIKEELHVGLVKFQYFVVVILESNSKMFAIYKSTLLLLPLILILLITPQVSSFLQPIQPPISPQVIKTHLSQLNSPQINSCFCHLIDL